MAETAGITETIKGYYNDHLLDAMRYTIAFRRFVTPAPEPDGEERLRWMIKKCRRLHRKPSLGLPQCIRDERTYYDY